MALVALFAVAWSSAATLAQGDLATLEVQSGQVEVREGAQGDYETVSSTSLALEEGNSLRWTSDAVGSIDFYNGLGIPVNGAGTTSEISIAEMTDSEEGVQVSQLSGRVLYNLRDTTSSGVSVADMIGDAEVTFSRGAVQVTQGEAVEREGVRTSLTWNLGTEGTLKVGTLFVDLFDVPNCQQYYAPRLDIYNSGSATAPTRVGISGAVRFSTLDTDATTEVMLGNTMLNIDGLATINICGQSYTTLTIEVIEADAPILIVNAETEQRITTAANGERMVFAPGAGAPLFQRSAIDQQPQPVECTAGTFQVFNGKIIYSPDSRNCAAQVERGNPNWTAIEQLGEVCVQNIFFVRNEVGDSLNVFRFGETEDDPVQFRNISNGGLNTVNFDVALSPDGRFVAYSTNKYGDGNLEIEIASIDGEFRQRVTFNDSAADVDPVWTNDALVYQSNVSGNWDIRVVNLATGANRALTDSPANDINPNVSPDGNVIYFSSDRPFSDANGVLVVGRSQIYAFDRTSDELTRLSDGTANDTGPRVSSDGSLIAFVSDRDNDTDRGLFTMDNDGEDIERRSILNANASEYSFSEDDDALGYTAELNDGTPADVYVYRFSEDVNIQVTASDGALRSAIDTEATFLCFSPTEMLVSSNTDGDFDLYRFTIPGDGDDPVVVSETTNLTSNDVINDRSSINTPKEDDPNDGSLLPPAFQG